MYLFSSCHCCVLTYLCISNIPRCLPLKVLTDCDMHAVRLVAAAVSRVITARNSFNFVNRSGRIEGTVVTVYKKRRPKCEFHSLILS